MRRRTFIAGLLVATAAGRAHAQQPAKLPTIGFLGTTTPPVWKDYVPAFVQRLRELGWVEGRTVAIEYRWAEGRNERFREIAAEFARPKVDVIVTSGGAGVAAKQATSTIPSSSRWRTTRSAAVWPRVWRGPAATSPACRCLLPILPASGSKLYASFCPMFADWPFWEMPAIPPPWLKWSTSRRQLTGSDLRR
jgi:hypothetical protein